MTILKPVRPLPSRNNGDYRHERGPPDKFLDVQFAKAITQSNDAKVSSKNRSTSTNDNEKVSHVLMNV